MDLYAFFQSEVKPTIGCTEPGAVAYAAAVAARHLPTQPEGIRLEMSIRTGVPWASRGRTACGG